MVKTKLSVSNTLTYVHVALHVYQLNAACVFEQVTTVGKVCVNSQKAYGQKMYKKKKDSQQFVS